VNGQEVWWYPGGYLKSDMPASRCPLLIVPHHLDDTSM
jgi:hypothetical protein